MGEPQIPVPASGAVAAARSAAGRAIAIVQVAAMVVALLALPLPLATLHSCGGGETSYTGLQWVFWGGAPLSLVPLGVMPLVVWWAVRRQPEAPDVRVLGAALVYFAATIATFFSFALPALEALFGHVEWHLGGWMHLGGWVLTTVLAGVGALSPVQATGPDVAPRLRMHSRVLRWVVLLGVPVLFLVALPFALAPVAEGEQSPSREMAGALAAAWLILVLPSFTLLRALEARLLAGRRGAVAMAWIGVVLAWAAVAFGVVGGVVNVLDALRAEEAEAAAAGELPASEETR